jgi:hypothetical protein
MSSHTIVLLVLYVIAVLFGYGVGYDVGFKRARDRYR